MALLGPRQCGKSTLAKALLARVPRSTYLDLERPSDLRKLQEPELYFDHHRDDLVCLDEIQRKPELFPLLRSEIDALRRPGRLLILGSASPALLRQSSESLAGRISYLELTPFLLGEAVPPGGDPRSLWLRGGYPDSFLAASDPKSVLWRQNFVRTYLERDLPQWGFRIPAGTVERFWRMCAHHHGQLINRSSIGESLGVSHTTVSSHLDVLADTFMVRLLPPLVPNLKKRLVKTPRLYIRDTGILHSLLDIESLDDLLSHPLLGASWKGFVVEQILSSLEGWRGSFYRTASGAELDLVLEKGRTRLAIECKVSPSPVVGRGFWTALSDLDVSEAWVVAPVKEPYPIDKRVTVGSLEFVLAALSSRGGARTAES